MYVIAAALAVGVWCVSASLWAHDDASHTESPGLALAKQLYEEGKLDEAQKAFEDCVRDNPSDVESRRYIKSIISIKRKMVKFDENIQERDRILDVRRAWIPIDKGGGGKDSKRAGDPGGLRASMQERVNRVIPEINFTDAQVREVLSYLSQISGVNIVFDEGSATSPHQTQSPVSPQDETALAQEEEPAEQSPANAPAVAPQPGQSQKKAADLDVAKILASRITIALKDVPMLEALKYILSLKGLKYRMDEYAIVVSTPERLESVEMESRYYHLSSGTAGFTAKKTKIRSKFRRSGKGEKPGTIESQTEMDGLGMEDDAAVESPVHSIKSVLEQSGVPFPPGSNIFLDKKTGTLLVRNTPGNLEVIEKILGALDVTPLQVAIEAKFVDIEEIAARELGLEVYLTKDFALTKQAGTNDLTIKADANNSVYGQYTAAGDGMGGLTKGIRFLTEGAGNPAGNIFSIAQILTQPQFQVVLHALEQSGLANVLSSPKVTTVNNEEARIEVVTEIIYPSEYEITPATHDGNGVLISPGVALPGNFVTRDTGVTLTVTPSVGSDRRVISLNLKPEVSALSGWNNFGTSAGPGGLGSNAIPVLQPIFTSQNVSTNVIVRDGETVVLGGLIREVTSTSDDKIPILGDIPGIGRLFRNQAESSRRRNLLVFVSAYLLTPEGETVREPKVAKTKIFNP